MRNAYKNFWQNECIFDFIIVRIDANKIWSFDFMHDQNHCKKHMTVFMLLQAKWNHNLIKKNDANAHFY